MGKTPDARFVNVLFLARTKIEENFVVYQVLKFFKGEKLIVFYKVKSRKVFPSFSLMLLRKFNAAEIFRNHFKKH